MKAPDLLKKAAGIMIERGKQYDKPEGERSMGAAVKAFNAITGKTLTEPEGWLLLQVLKDVRQWQNPDRYHADSAEDCIAYAALKAESMAGAEPESIECPIKWPDDDRIDAIGQNGPTAEHYPQHGKPSWDEAPEWARWLVQEESGFWFWFEERPTIDDLENNWDGGLGKIRYSNHGYVNGESWRDTLEARPQ